MAMAQRALVSEGGEVGAGKGERAVPVAACTATMAQTAVAAARSAAARVTRVAARVAVWAGGVLLVRAEAAAAAAGMAASEEEVRVAAGGRCSAQRVCRPQCAGCLARRRLRRASTCGKSRPATRCRETTRGMRRGQACPWTPQSRAWRWQARRVPEGCLRGPSQSSSRAVPPARA
jgi:hypothetical protein